VGTGTCGVINYLNTYTWDHDELINDGLTDGFWDYEWINERGFTAGTNDDNVDADPELVSTIAGPANDKSPANGSPLIDAAFDIDAAIDTANTDFTINPPTVVTIPADEIGPYSLAGGPPPNTASFGGGAIIGGE
jgi:hypothetical protein